MALVDDISKTLESFYKTCKYEKFYYKYQSFMNNKKLNEETKNYLRILHTNFLFLIDERRAFREHDRITLPTENKYLQAFYFLDIVILVKKKEFKEAEEKLKRYKSHKTLSKEDITSLQLFIDIYSDKEIKDIEKMFSLNNRLLYQNMFNARLLMDYYGLKGDKKCHDYALYIVKQKTDFTETINRAKDIIDVFK
ncbi:MAG: hypothetical protein J6Y28_08850 [Acholeplasmatales bacterium]|nr:hypothetical protein [Acholeplasmatales bacterium]